jgi:long-chain fatty acid transport protein
MVRQNPTGTPDLVVSTRQWIRTVTPSKDGWPTRIFLNSISLLSLPWYAAAVLAAGLPLKAAATDGPAMTGLIATADDAVTAATNPAGLTRLHESEWVGGIRAFYTASDFITTAQSVGGSFSNSSSNSLAIPSLYYARPINNDITLGISLTVPSGLGSDLGDATPGRYLLEKWTLAYVSLTPAAGYRVNEKLSVGVGVNLNYSLYDYQTAVFNGPGQSDGKMELRDSAFGVGFQLGTLYELTPMTRFGLTYTSSTTSNFSSTPELSGLTSQREALLPIGIRNRPVTLQSEFPQNVAAGAWHEFADGKSATLDVIWMNFSQFGLSSATLGNRSIEVSNSRYNNIWAVSAGMNWPLDEKWTLRFGALYASSGVDMQNRSFSFRLDRVCAVIRRRFPVGVNPTRQNAPAGSSRSSHGGNEVAEAFDITDHLG